MYPGSDREVYTIPYFAFVQIKTVRAPDGAPSVEEESVLFLTEMKRLYDEGSG